MRTRGNMWWLVLVGGVGLAVAALMLALTAQPSSDFGRSHVAPPGLETIESAADNLDQPTAGGQGLATPERERGIPVVPADARRPAQISGASPDRAAPTRLSIPVLDVDAEVVPVGVDPDGLMEIPASGQQVGWYRYGTAPGEERGSVVLASHINTRDEGDGVLTALHQLKPGDTLVVTLEDGRAVEYEVTDRQTVNKENLEPRALFDRAGPARLALVTCGGPWQEDRSSYRDNVIVLAEPAGATFKESGVTQ